MSPPHPSAEFATIQYAFVISEMAVGYMIQRVATGSFHLAAEEKMLDKNPQLSNPNCAREEGWDACTSRRYRMPTR